MPSQPSLGPLNIGNVVTTGFSLFKSGFNRYFKLSATAYLWVLVPVYGWAKFYMHHGLIGRLAFGQLMNQPETVEEARAVVQRRLWSFLLAAILVGLAVMGVYVAFILLLGMGGMVLAIIFGALIPSGGFLGTALGVLGVILGVALVLVFFFALAWLPGRFFLTDMEIAMAGQSGDATVAMGRSWRLTQAAVLRVMVIVFLAWLMTIPPSIVVNLVSQLASESLVQGSTLRSLIEAIASVLGILISMVTMPFWQCIKAATYYDLRARKEGLDLQLRGGPKDSLGHQSA